MTADIILNGNLEVNGNLNLNPTNSGTVNRSLIFSGNAKQIISGTGNISEGINFRNMEVGGGATVEMQRNLPMTNAGNKFLVKPNGNLETGTRVIGGNGSFELGPNGHLVIGSLSGITLTSGIGNIQTATRNFSNDGIYEYNGLGQQDSGDALPGNINTLFANKVSGDLIITASTKVMGVLNLNQGRIVCSENNMVSITSATTVISPVNNYGNINEGWEQSFVNGPIRLESNSTAVVVVPVGKNDRFAPVKIEKANSTPVNYTIEYFPSAFVDIVNIANPPLDHVSELEYWNIQTNVNNGDDDAQLSLSWRPGSGVGATDEERADLCVAHFEDRGNGLRWEMEGVDPVASGNASYGFITSDNITATFSSFTLGSESNNNVLPWKLLSFSAIPAKDRIQINWEIADEMDILAYAIERSSDGQIFHPLGRMISEHKKALSSYGFSDVKPMNGWNYYRLTIVDQANRLDYSQIIKIYYEPFSFRIFPNPVCGTLEIFLSTPRSRYNLDIVNSSGQVVKRFFSMPGRTLRVDDLQKGTYFLRVYNENQTVTRSFVKL